MQRTQAAKGNIQKEKKEYSPAATSAATAATTSPLATIAHLNLDTVSAKSSPIELLARVSCVPPVLKSSLSDNVDFSKREL